MATNCDKFYVIFYGKHPGIYRSKLLAMAQFSAQIWADDFIDPYDSLEDAVGAWLKQFGKAYKRQNHKLKICAYRSHFQTTGTCHYGWVHSPNIPVYLSPDPDQEEAIKLNDPIKKRKLSHEVQELESSAIHFMATMDKLSFKNKVTKK
jgi:hypothetical protein